MPESKRRKPKFPPPNKAIPRSRVLPLGGIEQDVPPEKPKRRGPVREIPPEQRHVITELPEPASYERVLVALADLDPLAQEILIAERLSMFPNPCEGGPPIGVDRRVRPIWAHQLRQLGIFVIPELATHQLTDTQFGVPSSLTQMTTDDLWERAKAQDPALAKLVDGAKTPEEKAKARKVLLSRMSAQQRLAMEKLMASTPEDLEPS